MIWNMEGSVDEELLSLRLGIATGSNKKKIMMKRKRKRRDDNFINNTLVLSDDESYEGQIFSLLQTREQMLKVEKRAAKAVADEEEDKGGGLHLIHLLLVSATAVDENTPGPAAESLSELYRRASLSGDAVQRVAAYFADALVARLLTRKSPFYHMIMKPPTPHEHLFAFTHLYRASPFHQFAHFTANQAIIEAFHQESHTNNATLHVIDFDVSHGFQWPSLIQSLSSPPTKISLKITAFGPTLSELRETEARLVSFAKGFRNLSFSFTGMLLNSIDYYTLAKITKTPHETVAVNLVFYLNRLPKFSDALRAVHLLSPSVVTVVEQEGFFRSPRNFLSRFMESLHYFAAMFDSLDDCLPIDSQERLSIEKNYLGNEIKRVMTNNGGCGEGDLIVPRYEKMETWKGRMESEGFCGVRLSCQNVMQAKLLLKIASSGGHCCRVRFDGGFRVFERDDGMAISLAWQDKPLTTASVWRCV
ncbi:PREDICTED: scarecrow-like protein 23 [Ipomoea nil]|uniref:scarecrow-like protein 23 n=1 Tax=Ipomoea nil TaxID=35883 RepID=UPI000901C329|nr:PREDICTED: scarecrow-like protein 23 [Ipomoea nil]